MSRSGYTDDTDDNWQHIMWRGRVASSIRGKRGQALLRDLLVALDAMPDKKLFPNNFSTAVGEYCTLGVLGAARGTKMDDLGDAEDGCNVRLVGERFGVAAPLVQEIMFMNDEGIYFQDTLSPQKRWEFMREWISKQIKETA